MTDKELGLALGEWLRETIQPIIEEVVDRKIQEYLKKKNPTYLTIMETCQKLGICEATFHNWARKVYENENAEGRGEMALLKLSELMNHSDPSITRRYIGLRQQELKEVYDTLKF